MSNGTQRSTGEDIVASIETMREGLGVAGARLAEVLTDLVRPVGPSAPFADVAPTALTDWLTDRLQEDYDIAWGAAPSPWSEGKWFGGINGGEVLDRHGDLTAAAHYSGTYGHLLRFDPTHVLNMIRSQQAVVALHSLADSVYDADGIERPGIDCRECWGEFPCPTLRHVASVYADHSDYDPAWVVS